MKIVITLILIIASFTVSAQNKVDTAAQRKQQEEINKFVNDFVSKTPIKDFQAWLYENNAGVKDFEVFNRLYNAYIEQSYKASKPKK